MRRDGALLVLVALAGAGTMVVELAAVRLLAPWFGASAAVWTNVIGVVLLALAVGYLLGARLSAAADPLRRLGFVLLAASCATAWLPFVAAPAARLFLPDGTTLDGAASQVRWGSLATSILLFLPAALALGAVGPLAVEVDQRRRARHAGDAGGRVLAASTVGSLVGTFGTTHVLVPHLGLRLCFLSAAGVLALLGLATLWRSGAAARATAGAALLTAAATVLVPLAEAGVPDGFRLLAARQSPYQSVRVVERESDGERWRELQVNEGFDSFQSVWRETPGFLGRGYYYDWFVLPAWLDERREGAWRTFVVGLGTGTAWRVMESTLPGALELDAVGVEIDPEVVALGREFLDLAPEGTPGRRVLAGADGRAGLAAAGVGFDQIVLDAYANQVEIPAHLSTVEFFREARAALRPGGWFSANVGAFGTDDPVAVALARTAAAAFERPAWLVRVPFSRNVLLVVRRDADVPVGDEVAAGLPNGWSEWLRFAPALRRFEPGDAPLTDDRNPIDLLQRRSLERAEDARR